MEWEKSQVQGEVCPPGRAGWDGEGSGGELTRQDPGRWCDTEMKGVRQGRGYVQLGKSWK